MTEKYHLCHLNVGLAKGHIHDPVMAGFVAQLERINQLAYDSPGFVWHLKIDINNPEHLAMYGEPGLLFNLSVWESVEDLKNYTYNSSHGVAMRSRKEWFGEMSGYNYVLWWQKAGELPTLEEAKQKLAYLNAHGPSPEGFIFKTPFSPPSPIVPSQAEPSLVKNL